MKNICVVGVGYVGLVTGTCFAELGNRVICLDIDAQRITDLRRGILPIYEPGLEDLVQRNMEANRLNFTTDYAEALRDAEIAFVAVGTPSGVDGQADLQYVRMAATKIARYMTSPLVIVNKSTVPVGTGDWVADIVAQHQVEPIPFWVVSNPEFLREGSALHDFMNPDRIVLGSRTPEAANEVAQLHLPLRAPILVTDLCTAEMIKYASNAFLATKISFINEIASICEAMGADVREVATGMGYDKRIGRAFLDAGIGYGGSCFPKDVNALFHMAVIHECHPQMLRSVMNINRDQRRKVVVWLGEMLDGLEGRTIGVLGLAFKPNTDDMREAPAVEIIHLLQEAGACIRVYDPVAMPNARRHLNEVQFMDNAYAAAEGCDAVLFATEWNEFKQLNLGRLKALMRLPILIDGRNIYDPGVMRAQGFIYRSIGRAPVDSAGKGHGAHLGQRSTIADQNGREPQQAPTMLLGAMARDDHAARLMDSPSAENGHGALVVDEVNEE